MEYTQQVPVLSPDGRSVITLGKFDGVHRGHQKLIRRVVETGRERNWTTIVFAFSNRDAKLLTAQERRILLEKMKIDIMIDSVLDEKMMHMRPEEFVRKILVDKLRAACVVVGPDFRFGYHRSGDTVLLKELGAEYGFTVEVLDKVMDGRRAISSTYVREQLNEGNMEKVAHLLGYNFSTTGEVIHGRGLGHTVLGVPTTNLRPSRKKLMPPNGVYVSRSYFEHRDYYGITNVGYKPSVGGESFLGVETFLFDCDEDLYGRQSTVEFYRFLRPERKFASLDLLKKQLDKDIEEGRKYVSD